jgi:hypothetical protein
MPALRSGCRLRTRMALAMLLSISFLGGLAPRPADAQHEEMATLTLHSRFCPPGYEGNELFDDCHGDAGIQGVQFGILGPRNASGTPGPSGNLTFSDLPAGAYIVRNTLPADLQRPAVYCSTGDGAEATRLEVDTAGPEPSVRIELTPGEALICDWYTIPEADYNSTRSNLTIHNRFCPIGYQGEDEFTDCHDDIGIAYISYALSGPESRNAVLDVGDATFSWLAPGRYALTTDSTLPAMVVCSDFNDVETVLFEQRVENGGPVSLQQEAGVSLVCDWYAYPDEAFYRNGMSVPVIVAACEEKQPISLGAGLFPEGCRGVANVTVTVYPNLAGPDYADACTTNADGICHVSLPFQVPLTAEVDESNLPAGYEPEANPFYAGVAFTEFAAVVVLLLPDPRGD